MDKGKVKESDTERGLRREGSVEGLCEGVKEGSR